MWPWSHLAFGYVLYSFTSRGWFGEPPSGVAVYVLLVATQVPDLVDKPLSWVFGVFPTGYAVGHSVFVAVPVGLAVVAIAARVDRVPTGVAFTVGYWSHIVGDLFSGVVTNQPRVRARVLWPVTTPPPYGEQIGAIERGLSYFVRFLGEVRTTDDLSILALYLGPFSLALLLWIVDGMPGVPRPRAQK